MQRRLMLALLLMGAALPTGQANTDDDKAWNGCLHCHEDERTGFNAAHGFARDNCAACHSGDPAALTQENAHQGLIRFPGDLATARRACGECHADRVLGVTNNLMHTGRGIVGVTRQTLEGEAGEDRNDNLQSLGHGIADSMLRKQCASCHLGQRKAMHALDVTRDRGGGCPACHINEYPDNGHPALTTRVDDGRCFGCHSRSGRISLSYAGLAEANPPADSADRPALRLADGRAVERLPADAHYLAGMSCIDCHTSVGLMGDTRDASHQRDAVDIDCKDCHDDNNTQITLSDWPTTLASMLKHVPFPIDGTTKFLTTSNNATPLWNIELLDDGAWIHTKNTGRKLRIPTMNPARPGHDPQHQRVTCAACHSQWAPQCFGCHMEYDAAGEQWDHIDKEVTGGRWSDRRWHVNNTLPALGVNEDGTIDAFVPGMIMTVAHPELNKNRFIRQFAPLSPHTIGAARPCASCHRSSTALGLGEGEIEYADDHLQFAPRHRLLQDGLPADAWTNSKNTRGGTAPFPGQRPLNPAEMRAIRGARISADQPSKD